MQRSFIQWTVIVGCLGISPCGGQEVKLHPEHVIAKARDVGDSSVAAYDLVFDLRIHNSGNQEIEIGSRPVFIWAVQVQQRDGHWKTLVSSSHYDDGTLSYSPCSKLMSGSSAVIPDIKSELVLLKTQWEELGEKPILRFHAQVFCQRPDGTKKGTPSVVSEPFTADLPASDRE